MNYKMNRIWDEAKGRMTVTISDASGKVFTGVALCHPEDIEFKSLSFGEAIAGARATIEFLRDIRDNEYKPQIKILTHLYGNMQTSKNFNPKSYEARMVRRQLGILKGELASIQEIIQQYKDQISYLIDTKESFNRLERSKSNNS